MKNDKTTSEVTEAAKNADAEQIEKNLDDKSVEDTDDNQAPFIDESLRTDK